jgi:hypothetical protein
MKNSNLNSNEIDNANDILLDLLLNYGLDHEWALYKIILNVCGFHDDEIINGPIPPNNLNKALLESCYERIINIPNDHEYAECLKYIVLGALILALNAKITNRLREKIIKATDWDAELKWRWKTIDKEKQKDFLQERKKLIDSFRQLILNYQS